MIFSLRISLLLTALVAPACLAESNKIYVIVNNTYHGRIGFDQTPSGEVCITAPPAQGMGNALSGRRRHVFLGRGLRDADGFDPA